MKKNWKNILIWSVLALPILVIGAGPSAGIPKNLAELTGSFNRWVAYIINLFWVLVVLSGIWGAYNFLSAQGDPKAAEKAKKIILYTVIAACVALLATVIESIAISILSAS
jgi:hypothetical protein